MLKSVRDAKLTEQDRKDIVEFLKPVRRVPDRRTTDAA